MNSKTVSSPNAMVNEYFDCLRDMIREIQGIDDPKEIRRKVLPSVLMGVAIVETFFNVYFRILVEEASCSACREKTLKELDMRKGLEHKLNTWPLRFFNRSIDFNQGIGERFKKLKDLRNELMHFKSSHEPYDKIPGVRIEGLADISCYDALDKNIAVESLAVAEGMIEEVFKMRGFTLDQIKAGLHLWAGKLPL